MILSKKRLKNSLNEVKRQINRRVTYNKEIIQNKKGKVSPPNGITNFTDATLDSQLPASLHGWSADSTANHNTACIQDTGSRLQTAGAVNADYV